MSVPLLSLIPMNLTSDLKKSFLIDLFLGSTTASIDILFSQRNAYYHLTPLALTYSFLINVTYSMVAQVSQGARHVV